MALLFLPIVSYIVRINLYDGNEHVSSLLIDLKM